MFLKTKKKIFHFISMPTLCLLILSTVCGGSFFTQPAEAIVFTQGQTTKLEIWDTDADGSCDTLKLYVANPNSTTWTVGTNGSSLERWISGSPWWSTYTVVGISINGAANANPVVIDVALDESEWGKNTDLNGYSNLEYGYASVGLGNGGIEDGVVEMNNITKGSDADFHDTELDKAPPIIKTFYYQDIDADGKIDTMFIELTEGVAAGSVVRPIDLIFTNVGDFTSAAYGVDVTNYFGSPGVIGASMALGYEASVIATYESSGNIAISTQNSFNLVDSDGNINNTLGAQPQAVFEDYAKPFLLNFTSSTANGTYGPGSVIDITATYSENLKSPSTLTANLDNGASALLNNITGATVTGSYTVGVTGSGEDTADLTVTSISGESVRDFGCSLVGDNVRTNSSVPGSPNNIADIKDIVIDTTAPTIPSIPDLNAASDTGGSNSDDITNVNTPTLDGTGPASTTVRVFSDQDGLLGSTVSDGAGNWSFTVPALSENTHAFTATAVDAYGNESAASAGLSVVIDLTSPSVTSVNPTGGASNVGISSSVVVNFDESMDTTTFTINDDDSNNYTSNVWTDSNKIYTGGHDAWGLNTAISITIDGSDVAGNSVNGAGNYQWFFSTSSGGRSCDMPYGTVTINSGATETTIPNVTLNFTYANANYMIYSESQYFSDTNWSVVSDTSLFTLSEGAGEKTVYVMFKSGCGLSPMYSAVIDYQPEEIVEEEPVGEEPVILPPEPELYLILEDPIPAGPLPAGVAVGQVVKSPDMSTIYFIDNDNRRHTFPNEIVFFSWYASFDEVKTVSNSTLAMIPLGSNVIMRPGTYLIKIPSLPYVYAVEPYGVIRWLETEDIAQALYGFSWAARVRDVSEVFFGDYQVGTSISDYIYPTASLIQYVGESDVYYVENETKHYVSPISFIGNLFQERFIVTDADMTASPSLGDDLPTMGSEAWMTLR